MDKKYIDIDPEASSVQTHLGIIQNVIQRMSANSSSCKAWCISLVAAILVIIADKETPEYIWISIIPIVLFSALDAYYLALEKAFRNSYNDFIGKLHNNELLESDLYSVMPLGSMTRLQIDSFKSFSVWGFYASLLFLVFIMKMVVFNI